MSNDVVTGSTATPPPVALLQMMTGYWVSQAIYVAAKLGIADLLAHAPLSAGSCQVERGSAINLV